MGKTVVVTESAPRAIGPYSQGIASGGMLFLSGQIGLDPATGVLVEGGVEVEARRCLENIGAVLRAHGLGYEHVVKTTLYLVRMSDFETVNRVYGEFFKLDPPARATVAVAALPRSAQIELEAIACEGAA